MTVIAVSVLLVSALSVGCGTSAGGPVVTSGAAATTDTAESEQSSKSSGETETDANLREYKAGDYKPDVKLALKNAKTEATKEKEGKVLSGYGFERGNLGDVAIAKGETFARVKIKNYGTIDFKLYKELTPIAYEHFTKDAASGYYSGKKIHRIMKDFMFQGGSANGDGLSGANEEGFGIEPTPELRHFYGALCYANAGGVNGTQFYVVNTKKYASPDHDAAVKISNVENSAALKKMKDFLALPKDKRAASKLIPDDQKEYVAKLGDNEGEYKKFIDTQTAYYKTAVEVADKATAKYEKAGGTNFLDGNYTVFGQAVNGFDVIDKVSAISVEDSARGESSKPKTDVVIESVEILVKE